MTWLRRYYIWIIGSIASLVVAVSLFSILGKEKEVAEPKSVINASSPFIATAQGTADVEGGLIRVASRVPGVIEEVYVQEGEQVTRGQILARQDAISADLNLKTARASLNQAEADIGPARVLVSAAARERRRLGSVVDIVSGQQVDQAQDALATARATLQQRVAAISLARARVIEARYGIEQNVVRAPINGTIVRRYANPGTGASTLNVTALFDLLPNTRRIVRAEVTEQSVFLIKQGGKVILSPESDTSKSYEGTVLRKVDAFGARRLQPDDVASRTDERVLEVVIDATSAPFIVGQRVLVRFKK